jgi:poly-gamma-glutamate capsule biosynthesis protein CapA/YwtB (metallophosphatase superfamily)
MFAILYSLNNLVFTLGGTEIQTMYVENQWYAIYGP